LQIPVWKKIHSRVEAVFDVLLQPDFSPFQKEFGVFASRWYLRGNAKSNERLLHTFGLARRDGKRTWKTPKAA